MGSFHGVTINVCGQNHLVMLQKMSDEGIFVMLGGLNRCISRFMPGIQPEKKNR